MMLFLINKCLFLGTCLVVVQELRIIKIEKKKLEDFAS